MAAGSSDEARGFLLLEEAGGEGESMGGRGGSGRFLSREHRVGSAVEGGGLEGAVGGAGVGALGGEVSSSSVLSSCWLLLLLSSAARRAAVRVVGTDEEEGCVGDRWRASSWA
jgi:hypothetical protein